MSPEKQFDRLSPVGVPGDGAEQTSENLSAARSRVASGTAFDPHFHQEDQIAWMSSGAMTVLVQGDRWTLRHEHLVWIPAGMLHEMRFAEPGELLSVYLDPAVRPVGEGWDQPRTLGADGLTRALITHLVDGAADAGRRIRCRRLLTDLLETADVVHDVVAVPRDPRARVVATTLLANPADTRDLEAWAAEIGVSAKTISRAFVADTGTSFREWRTHAKLHSAAGMLASGQSVQSVAWAVGYESASSFIAAFRTRFGLTPSRYATGSRLTER